MTRAARKGQFSEGEKIIVINNQGRLKSVISFPTRAIIYREPNYVNEQQQ